MIHKRLWRPEWEEGGCDSPSKTGNGLFGARRGGDTRAGSGHKLAGGTKAGGWTGCGVSRKGTTNVSKVCGLNNWRAEAMGKAAGGAGFWRGWG